MSLEKHEWIEAPFSERELATFAYLDIIGKEYKLIVPEIKVVDQDLSLNLEQASVCEKKDGYYEIRSGYAFTPDRQDITIHEIIHALHMENNAFLSKNWDLRGRAEQDLYYSIFFGKSILPVVITQALTKFDTELVATYFGYTFDRNNSPTIDLHNSRAVIGIGLKAWMENMNAIKNIMSEETSFIDRALSIPIVGNLTETIANCGYVMGLQAGEILAVNKDSVVNERELFFVEPRELVRATSQAYLNSEDDIEFNQSLVKEVNLLLAHEE